MRVRRRDNHRRTWLLIGLCLALVFPSSVAEARKDQDSDRCEGTKKQRKQKMAKREITQAQLKAMIAQHKKVLSEERALVEETMARRLSREYEAHEATGAPFVYDMLIISGGGAKGAFGAGFLEGWGKIESGPYARPEFDMVTGVSTGALLAPFFLLGTDEAYTSAAEFYADPEPNWTKKRGMISFLPSHISMYNNCRLQETIREAVDPSMIESLAKATAEDKLLLIGTTNLDVGAGRVFNLGEEASQALENSARDRVAQILLASSALPGVFPPIEIDGLLYADGGATSNLFIANFPGPDGPVARFKAEHPEAPLPKVRVWVLVNEQLKPHHAVTQPRWISISKRALDTMLSTSQLFALELVRNMVHEARTEQGLDVDLHIVSIPEDAPEQTTSEMFDKAWMDQLEDLGRKMGADPTSWTDSVPSAYEVYGGWIESP